MVESGPCQLPFLCPTTFGSFLRPFLTVQKWRYHHFGWLPHECVSRKPFACVCVCCLTRAPSSYTLHRGLGTVAIWLWPCGVRGAVLMRGRVGRRRAAGARGGGVGIRVPIRVVNVGGIALVIPGGDTRVDRECTQSSNERGLPTEFKIDAASRSSLRRSAGRTVHSASRAG